MTFKTALSGLNAASVDLAVTGNNIANASTNGFKESRAEFADVYATSFQGLGAVTPGSGVRVAQIAQQFNQGNVDFTSNNLDLAINGEGFYTLDDNGSAAYTRAGAFSADRDGYIVNHAGQRLQVFPAVTNAGVTTFNTGILQDLQLATTVAPPNPTSSIDSNVNLDSRETPPTGAFDPNDPTTFNSSTSLTLYDSLGSQHTGTYYYVNSGINQWNSFLYVDGTPAPVAGGGASAPLVFGTDGSLTSAAGNANGQFNYAAFPVSGAAALNITIDMSASTQYGNTFSVNDLGQNGFTTGRLNGIDISDDGVVFSRFTNGQSQGLGQVALAKFPNSQGLTKLGDTNWAESFESGDVLYGAPRSSNFGGIQAGALEGSTVDISDQLVNLIVAQRNFQANAQVITTEDTITQTIINIR